MAGAVLVTERRSSGALLSALPGVPLCSASHAASRCCAACRNYTRTLSVSAAELGCASVELVFDGLDTIAEVRLNGRLVLSSSNQFRRYTVGARPFLVPGSNSLSLSFQSPMLWARAYHDRYPYELPGPRPQQDDPAEAIPYRNYIRKVQSDFDWSVLSSHSSGRQAV